MTSQPTSPSTSPRPAMARTLWAALQFYTVIPFYKFIRPPTSAEMAAGHSLLPLVGLLLAFCQIGCWWALTAIFRQPVAAAGAAALCWWLLPIIVTRGLHEDGLADFADGMWGGATVARRLAIMKDSRIGAFGVQALLADALISIGSMTLIMATATPPLIAGAVIAAAVLPRSAALLLTLPLPYARGPDNPGIVSATPIKLGGRFYASVGCGAFASALLLGLSPFIGSLAVTTAVTFGLYRLLKAQLGGYTGDCLGAAIKITTLGVITTFAALWG